MSIYCFDIDGVVCETKDGNYHNAQPKYKRIEKINALYKGNRIIFFTARGYESGINWEKITKRQFREWGLKYHQIIFHKPHADFYIDDKGQNDKQFFND